MKFDRRELTKAQIANRVEYVLLRGSTFGVSWIMAVLDGRQMSDEALARNLKEYKEQS